MWKVYVAYENEYSDHFTWKRVAWNIATKDEAEDIAQLFYQTDWDIVRLIISKKSLKKMLEFNNLTSV